MNEREIFVAALAAADDRERNRVLDDACDSNSHLRERLERLLNAERQLGTFLESSPVGSAPTDAVALDLEQTADLPTGPLRMGEMIGPYQILRPLGEGGFGIVFMAEQLAPVRRKVAVKVIKPGMDTHEVIARFEAERQALALMDHPNIAKVLDCGTTDCGAPYFVMELVQGVPITEFCDQHGLETARRIELFSVVCHAVQHAHQKGVIHRDIKPSNILVATSDGAPRPMIIDFGISKAIETGQAGQTTATGFGRMLGTPLYMSPEQASLTGGDVDTRADVYSLGVVLYELLTGATPFSKDQVKNVASDEFRRMIQFDEPAKPSSRVTASDSCVERSDLPSRSDRQKLAGLLQRDLDWLVMKALAKDRDRRYPTAASLAEDIQRYLNHQPVEARPPSPLYQFSKFARRHQRSLATAAALTLVCLVGFGASIWQSVRAGRSERVARDEAAISEAVLGFINHDLLGRANPHIEPDRDLKVRDALDRAARRIDDRFSKQPRVEAAIRHAVGTSYLTLGETGKAHDHLAKAAAMHQRLLGDEHPKTVASRSHLAICLCEMGEPEKAEALHQDVLALQLKRAGADNAETLGTRMNLSAAVFDQGRFKEAHQTTVELLQKCLEILGPMHPTTLRCMGNLGNLNRVIGAFDEAEAICRELLDLQTELLAPSHPDVLSNLSVLGNVAVAQGRLHDAIDLHQRALDGRKRTFGEDHPTTLSSGNNLAVVTLRLGRIAEAEKLRHELLAAHLRVFGEDHPATLECQMNLANILFAQGKLEEARQLHSQVLARRQETLGKEHPDTLQSEFNFLNVINAEGRHAEAEDRFKRLLEIQSRVLGPDHADTLAVRTNLAVAIFQQGKDRLREAEDLRRETLEIKRRVLGAKHPDTLASQLNLANTLKARGEYDDAERNYREVLPAMRETLGEEHPFTLKCMLALARTITSSKPVEAESLLRDALRTHRDAYAPDHPDTLRNIQMLAWFLAFSAPEPQREPNEAVQLAEELIQYGPDNRRFQQTLAQALHRNGQWSDAKKVLEHSLKSRGPNYHDLLTLSLVYWRLGESAKSTELYERLRECDLKRPSHQRLLQELQALMDAST